MLTTLAAWPPVAECRFAPPATTSRVVPRPSTRPPGGTSPNHLRGGCPATARLAARFNQYDAAKPPPTSSHCSACATQSLDENQAARAAENEKPCPSLRDRHPVFRLRRWLRRTCVPPARHALPWRYRTQRTIPLFVLPSRFYLHRSRYCSLRCAPT